MVERKTGRPLCGAHGRLPVTVESDRVSVNPAPVPPLGIWYAVIELFYAEDPITRRSVDLVHEKCDGKIAAIEATRKLLVEKAKNFSDQISIEPSIYCELEWVPPGD